MTNPAKLQAGSDFPSIALAKIGGGEIKVGGTGSWQMLVVYRGKHCPLCRKYLKTLDGLLDDFRAADIQVVAASGDPREKAQAEVAEEGWRFSVGYGLTPDQMRALGLYISNPRSPKETDRPFPEPGLFVVNPEGKAQIIDISNAPFSRPDLANVLNGLKFIREKNYPVRGTAR
jgi:peroxiredoxin